MRSLGRNPAVPPAPQATSVTATGPSSKRIARTAASPCVPPGLTSGSMPQADPVANTWPPAVLGDDRAKSGIHERTNTNSAFYSFRGWNDAHTSRTSGCSGTHDLSQNRPRLTGGAAAVSRPSLRSRAQPARPYARACAGSSPAEDASSPRPPRRPAVARWFGRTGSGSRGSVCR